MREKILEAGKLENTLYKMDSDDDGMLNGTPGQYTPGMVTPMGGGMEQSTISGERMPISLMKTSTMSS